LIQTLFFLSRPNVADLWQSTTRLQRYWDWRIKSLK